MGKHVQNPAVEALNMNSQKITSLANGTASGDAVNFGQLSGMVTGSGAANRVAYWSGASALTSDANFSWNGTGLGAGVASASHKLHVRGGTSMLDSPGGISRFYFSGGANDANWAQLFLYNAAGTNTARIDSNGTSFFKSGPVGIGTDAPVTMLDVRQAPVTNQEFMFFGDTVDSKGLSFGYFTTPDAAWIQGLHRNVAYKNLILQMNGGNLGVGSQAVPTARFDVTGTVRFRDFTTANNLLQHDGSGNLVSVSPYNFSGTLTASRTMTLGSNSFTLDASGAASSPATMLILKGKETSFSTRFIDYQNESGVTSFRMSSTSSQVTLAALNSHDLRVEGVNSVTITNNLDRGFVVKSSGEVAFHSGLSTAPSSPATASMWWLSDRLQIKKSGAVANIATVEDDLMGNATQVITASTHTLTGQDYFTRYSASSNAIVVTLGDSLLEGKSYRVRCTGNGTNTVTFNAGGSNVFYVDEKSTTTLTTLVTGAGGTGIEAPNRILTIVRRDNVIWIF
jgi:hypothetical protein